MQKTEVHLLLEKILKREVSAFDVLGLAQSVCLSFLSGEYKEFEEEIKLLAKKIKEHFNKL